MLQTISLHSTFLVYFTHFLTLATAGTSRRPMALLSPFGTLHRLSPQIFLSVLDCITFMPRTSGRYMDGENVP